MIEKELHILKAKLISSSAELADGDPLLIQFAEVLDKYEQRVAHFHATTKRAQMQIQNIHNTTHNQSLISQGGPASLSIVENSLYAGLENDAVEISKIKQDLMALRYEIEASEQEDFSSMEMQSRAMTTPSI